MSYVSTHIILCCSSSMHQHFLHLAPRVNSCWRRKWQSTNARHKESSHEPVQLLGETICVELFSFSSCHKFAFRLLFQFFDKTGAAPKLYRFPTADCVITERTQKTITVDQTQATAVYTIVGEPFTLTMFHNRTVWPLNIAWIADWDCQALVFLPPLIPGDGERPCTKWRDSVQPEDQSGPQQSYSPSQTPQEDREGSRQIVRDQDVSHTQDVLTAHHQESMYRSTSNAATCASFDFLLSSVLTVVILLSAQASVVWWRKVGGEIRRGTIFGLCSKRQRIAKLRSGGASLGQDSFRRLEPHMTVLAHG